MSAVGFLQEKSQPADDNPGVAERIYVGTKILVQLMNDMPNTADEILIRKARKLTDEFLQEMSR